MSDRQCVKKCTTCARELVWHHPSVNSFMASSADIDDWPHCHDCMVEHCVSTNCLGCSYGVYPDCQFLEFKKYYMSND